MNKTFKNKDGKTIGILEGKSFRKLVSEKRHLMVKWDAWGIDAEVIDSLPEDCNIVIYDTDKDITYVTTVWTYKDKGRRERFGAYGVQYFLKRKKFDAGGTLPMF